MNKPDQRRLPCWLALPLGLLLFAGNAAAQQNVVVVIDDSGSMSEVMPDGFTQRMEAAKSALVSVLNELPEETQVGVLALNTQVDGTPWILPLGPLAARSWQARVSQLQPFGGTPLGGYLKLGADALIEARQQQIYGEYRLLVVTDGEANDPDSVSHYLPQIMSRGLSIDVIGVDMAGDHSLATQVHTYRRAADPDSLQQALQEVFAETSWEDGDAADEFELLDGLPDEFAEAAIVALTTVNNRPLDRHGSGQSVGNSGSMHVSTSSSGQVGFAAAFFGSCCVVGFGFLMVVVFVIVLIRPRKRGRR